MIFSFCTKFDKNLSLSIASTGRVNMQGVTLSYSINPVCYLKPDVKIAGGSGSISAPFLLEFQTE